MHQQQQQQQFMPDVDSVLRLFDSYWFEFEIFGKNNHPYASLIPSNSIRETFPTKSFEEVQDNFSKFSRVPTILVRSLSDQLSSQSSFRSNSISPNSVLTQRKLETIASGKEVMEQDQDYDVSSSSPSSSSPSRFNKYGGRRKKRASSKSLSQLEFEEVKGFMDLGFVFSEEDKNSTLVSIIPGLQRLGNSSNNDGEEEITSDVTKCEVSRPYLSEAWEYWDEKRKENRLMNWTVPSTSNEADVKDSLRWWAHTVASTVR